MSNKKLNIFFDLDGTLIDISKKHYSVYREIVESLEGKPLEQKKYWRLKRAKKSVDGILNKSKLKNENQKLLFQELFKDKIEQVKNLKFDTLFKNTIKLLTKLKKNYNLYLLTIRESKKNTYLQIDWLGIKKIFKEIIIGHSEQLGYLYKEKLLARKQYGKYDVVVGDSEADILAAKKLGLISIAVLSGIRNRKYLESLKPTYILENLNSLPKILI